MVMKYWKELKENKILLGVGDKQDSGSESKPEEGEIKVSDLKSKQV